MGGLVGSGLTVGAGRGGRRRRRGGGRDDRRRQQRSGRDRGDAKRRQGAAAGTGTGHPDLLVESGGQSSRPTVKPPSPKPIARPSTGTSAASTGISAASTGTRALSTGMRALSTGMRALSTSRGSAAEVRRAVDVDDGAGAEPGLGRGKPQHRGGHLLG